MSKCDVNVQSLKLILTKVATTLRSYLKNKESIDTLKDKMIKVFNDVSEQYDLTNINDIVNSIYGTIQKYGVIDKSSDFFNVLNISNILVRADQGIQQIDTIETSTDRLTDTELVQIRVEANRAFLDNAFGLAKEVLTYLINTTNLNLFDCCFINRGSVNQNLGIVKNTTELNENIRQYQESLFRKIADYIINTINTSSNLKRRLEYKDLIQRLSTAKIYDVVDGEIVNTGILEELRSIIQSYLSAENFTPDILRQLYNSINSDTVSAELKLLDKMRLEAFNANLLLNHFDSYLSLMLGLSLKIKDFNKKTGKDKYQIAKKTAKLATTWRVSENIDVESEIDGITKLAINTTPLFRWLEDIPLTGKYLHFLDFLRIIAKVKELGLRLDAMLLTFNDLFINENRDIWDNLTPESLNLFYNKSLSLAINLIRRNPRLYLNSIFELLSNREFYQGDFISRKLFTKDELNKLYSISKGIFDSNSDNSLFSLSDVDANNDFYAYITLAADTIFNVSYLLYYKDESGVIQVRTLIDLSVNNVRRSIELTINSSNSIKFINDINDFKKSLQLSRNTDDGFKYIEFTIPNTKYRVRATASSGSISIMLDGKAVTNFESLWKEDTIKLFIDDILRINISNNIDLQTTLKKTSYGELCKGLVSFASRIVMNRYISKEFLENKSRKEREAILNTIYGRSVPKFNYALDEIGLIHTTDIPMLRDIANAKATLQGITTASLAKDGEGNEQSLQTLSRLLGSLQSLFDLQERRSDSATNGCLLLTVPGIFEGVFTSKEFHDLTGDNKTSTAMNSGEMAYSSLVYDFIGGLLTRDPDSTVGNGHVMFLPSVNSDKTTIGRIKIDLNKQIDFNGRLVAIKDLAPLELKEVIALDLGNIYSKIVLAILLDWADVYNYLINSYNDPIIETIPNLAFDYIDNFEAFNSWWEANKLALIEFGETPVDFIKTVVADYNTTRRLNPISIIDLMHYLNKKGRLLSNQVVFSLIARFNPELFNSLGGNPEIYPNQELFWNTKQLEILRGLLKNRLQINTTATELPELLYIRNTYPNWINASGNVILAKILSGNTTYGITSLEDLAKLSNIDTNSIVLHPVIELYNYLDYLFTLEFMLSTVGTFANHPEKSGSKDVLELEAAHFLALHKRNVSFTAAMHAFLLNLLNGIPEYYNVAVIEDITDFQGTINGVVSKIKPFDGATFVNPFVVYLENNSLGGAKAGISKKLFVHFKDHRTGSGGIIKTAGFGLTNDWIRNSPFLEKMMYKMTNHQWLNQNGAPATVDITTNYKGEKIVYDNFYFKLGDKIYKILDINSKGNNTYDRTLLEVKKDGTPVNTDPILEENILVDNNYALWNFFGGKNSMTMGEGFLKLSNTSVENVVTAMNLIGTPKGNYNKILTLDLLWQPLKMVDVHYVATAGAVKQGAANINSANKYYNDLNYDILRIYMYQAGILLDKEHHADDSELSLMTLVISSCAAKGYTFEAAVGLYEALRKSTEIGTKEHLVPMLNLFKGTGSESSVLEVVLKTIVDSLSTSNSTNFATIVASNLIEQAREGKEIKFADEAMLPLSDNTVYSKIFAIISSSLTNSGIKLKIPGVLSVLTPSHNIFKVYADRKYESFVNPLEELSELQRNQLPIFDRANLYQEGQTEFQGMLLVYVNPGELISPTDNLPVAMRNPHDGRVLIDLELMREKFDQKAWRNTRNSEPLNYDFKSFNEWVNFALLHEAMHNIYPIQEGETRFQYETRINQEALLRLSNNISNLELGRTYLIDGVPKLINTPTEYYQLKAAIKNGEVNNITEDITAGRDLAAYNVRFNTIEGESFLIWDLDSAKALFDLNTLSDNWSGSESNLETLLNIYQALFGVSPTITIDQAELYLETIKIRARRMLLRDLMNLSESTPNLFEQYYALLKLTTLNQESLNRYAQWVNILLGRGDGSYLTIRGLRTRVTPENFEQIEPIVNRLLNTATQVRVDGQYHTVDMNSIKILPYELIMPKTFATKFGLSEFDDLNSIKLDKDFFIKLYLRNNVTKLDNKQFTLEFKNSNGNHLYVLTKQLALHAGLTKIDNIFTVVENGKLYRVDSNGNTLYELTEDTEIYVDSLGLEVIVTDDLKHYIDNLHYDDIKLSNVLINRPKLLGEILSNFKESINKRALKFGRIITSEGLRPLNVMNLNLMHHSLTLDNYLYADKNNPTIKAGRAKHTSFLKSLDIVAARIPAQSMQSFMSMRVIAYDNPDINTAYVSTMLILLLGSDYDIDTVSLETFDIDTNGILQLWSPYANIETIELLEASAKIPLPTGSVIEALETSSDAKVLELTLQDLEYFASNIFSINRQYIYNKETKSLEVDNTQVNVILNLDTPLKIEQFIEFLQVMPRLVMPDSSYVLKFAAELYNRNIISFLLSNNVQTIDIFRKLAEIVNNHNTYLDKLSKYNLSKVINNYSVHSMYEVSSDPVNLIQAHTSVDGTTGPLKREANKSKEAKEASSRTPGNFVNKYESIIENLEGKEGIGICAVGLKTFFGLTLYNNYLLNLGTPELQAKLLLGSEGITINGKVYKTIANIRAKDPNTITNADVLEALSLVNNDNDAALVLSALLSLATDPRTLVKFLV